MPSIVTDPFRIRNAKEFVDSVGANSIYLSIGNPLPWTLRSSTDTDPPIPFDATTETQRSQWDDMLAAKLVTTADVRHAVKRYDWTSGTRYNVYDPTDTELFRRAFYVVTSGYNVYKCLDRPAVSGNSTVEPTHTTASPVTLGDGFTWKFMYTISTPDAVKFITPQHIPVPDTLNAGNTFLFGTSTDNPVSADGTVGHGYDPVRELGAYFIAVNIRLEFDEGGTFATENDYRKICLLEDPYLFGTTTVATGASYRQTTLLNLSAPPVTAFQPDEVVTAPSGATGTVVEYDGTELYIYVTSATDFVPTDVVTGGTSGATETVDTVSSPGLEEYTGDLLFVEYRRPIPRSTDQVESISIVLEF